MWPVSYEGYWNSRRGADRPPFPPKDLDLEAILAEARQKRAEELARSLRAFGRSIVGGLRGWIIDPLVGHWRRGRLERELSALSDAMLADIGIGRGDIPRIVREAYRRPTGESVPVTATTANDLNRSIDTAEATKRAA